MSAVMTEPGMAAGPAEGDLAAGSSPDLAVRSGRRPRGWLDDPSPDRSDPVVDDPDTEELDLAALLVAGSRPSGSAPSSLPSRATLARVAPCQLERPPRRPGHLDGRGARAIGAGRHPLGRLAGEGAAAEVGRLGLHLLLAALPLLAISAQVFGIVDMNVSAGLLVLPLTAVMVAVSVLRPVSSDRVVVAGMVWGLLATVVYDGFRLDTVYLLGWWGDFIPKMGTWLIHTDPSHLGEGALAGYVWRYLGDGGGIGVVFFVAAAATGLRRLGPRVTVAAAVGFAVFPVWAGLIGTVALASRGQSMMFPLTPTTVVLSLIGHLIFGLVLGLGTVRCEVIETAWPWSPLLERLTRRAGLGARVPWASIALPDPRPADALTDRPRPVTCARRGTGREGDVHRRWHGAAVSGPLAVPSVRGSGTGSVPVPPPRGGPGLVGTATSDVPSWPGSSARVVRGWPSSPGPAVVGVAAINHRGTR